MMSSFRKQMLEEAHQIELNRMKNDPDYWKEKRRRETEIEIRQHRHDFEKDIEDIKEKLGKLLVATEKMEAKNEWLKASENDPIQDGWYRTTVKSSFEDDRYMELAWWNHGWHHTTGEVIAFIPEPIEEIDPYEGEE